MTAKTDALPPRRDPGSEPRIEWIADRSDERVLLVWASVIAVLVHGLAFMIDLPEPRVTVPPPDPKGPTIWDTPLPPPPPRASDLPPRKDTTRRMPIPDQEPDSLDPVTEPPLEIFEDNVIDDMIDLPMAAAVAPPGPSDPLVISHGITDPILIEESKVPPVYPEIARLSKKSGCVILQAVIQRDGSVGEITVLRCDEPGFGFEEAAVEAVRQWRYEPATQLGNPVAVYFTVSVQFDLR